MLRTVSKANNNPIIQQLKTENENRQLSSDGEFSSGGREINQIIKNSAVARRRRQNEG